MEHTLYEFNSSQKVIELQTKYTLFKRVENILFRTVIANGYDKGLMRDAINLLFKRNDCLRIRFVKNGKERLQYFEDERTIGAIPSLRFETITQEDAFIKKFRKTPVNCYKGRPLEVVFAENAIGEKEIYFKISHYVADTYGIGILVGDLFGIYDALSKGTELPAAPGSFEKVLVKDLEFSSSPELCAKDKEFFEEYYGSHAEPKPMFNGLQGNKSDEWLKHKRKGAISMPFYFVKCDTKGYKLNMPSVLGRKANEWCEKNRITLSTFFYYTITIASSLVNDRIRYVAPLLLLDCRGTLTERKAAGTKVQPLSIYETVDYDRSFNDNIRDAFIAHQELYKHTRLKYTEAEAIQHRIWGHSRLSQTSGFSFSFVPTSAPEGVDMQIISNGKGALPAYIALMFNIKTGAISVIYDVQTMMIEGEVLGEFHNTYLRVIESVLDNPDTEMKKLF